ncbi:hypothetical protein HKCCE4037_06835 [Rhodobacterales bacterium HKCCE4037]|nr:hypothetical protein [Rhodobacterales bacterium HKCCE4037]
MSAFPVSPSGQQRLLDRAARFVDRAKALMAQPALTQTEAARALDHLARMQGDLAETRKAAGSGTAQVERAEDAIRSARKAMTEALLRAEPGETRMGLVPHGAAELDDMKVVPASICRSMLDLDALRPYLDEAALRTALARRCAATGRADVSGVAYAALPASALLDCPIL